MKKIILTVLILILSTGYTFAEISLEGEIKSDIRAKFKNTEYLYNEENLLLKCKADLSDNLAGYASINFRYQNFPSITNPADLNHRYNVEPLELQLKEAYIDYFSFLFNRLDLRVGKQRIAWGTADKMNPTDNLNPDDLTDIFNFGEKIPSLAVKAEFYLNDDFSLTGIWLPYFTPARFSDNEFNYPAMLDANLSAQILPELTRIGLLASISSINGTIKMPEKKMKNSMYAFKLSGKLFNFDFSLSYFKGYDDIPIINNLYIDATTPSSTSISYNMIYPGLQVIGLDTAGEILEVGVWAEAACFIPEEVKSVSTIVISASPFPIKSTNTALDKEPYFKYTVGFDYTFKNGIYFNSQFIHGFFMERGYHQEKPQDYVAGSIEKKFFDDKLKIKLIGAAGVKDLHKAKKFKDVKKNSGNMWGPEINYYPVDNTELILGCMAIEGSDKTFFGKMKNDDQLYIKFKLYF